MNRLKKENRLIMYGPFSDATGGAFIIRAGTMEEAKRIGQSDPLVKNGSSKVVIKEWMTK
jgi:uncharacterized protein